MSDTASMQRQWFEESSQTHHVERSERVAIEKSLIASGAASDLADLRRMRERVATLHPEANAKGSLDFDITVSHAPANLKWDETCHQFKSLLGLPSQRPMEFSVLTGVRASLASGEMTLLVGASGSGKSTLLRAISGRLHAQDHIEGTLSINGEGFDLRAWQLRRLVTLIDEHDKSHAPVLSVQETVEFVAAASARPDPHQAALVGLEAMQLAHVAKTQVCLIMDGPLSRPSLEALSRWPPSLIPCSPPTAVRWSISQVGDEALRGVSGGQKRRVTVIEMLSTDVPFICADQPTNGLDGQTAVSLPCHSHRPAHLSSRLSLAP